MAEACIPVKRDHLCCRLCRGVLRNPATTPCGHNFCMLCIQQYWDHDNRSDETWRCPECGCTFYSRPLLIKNTTLADLVKDMQRSEAGAGRESEQPQPLKRPRTSITIGASGGSMCLQHNVPLDVYCCTDGQCICQTCALFEHIGHRIECVSEARQRKQEELGNIKKQRIQIRGEERRKLRNNLKQIEEGARAAEEYCECIIAKLIDCLQRHYGTVKELIEAQERTAAAQARRSLQTLELRLLEEHKNRENELNQLSQMDDDVHFLQKCPSLLSLCDADEVPSVSEYPLPPFEPIKTAVQLFGRLLEAFCDKEINAIYQTVGTHAGPTVSTHTGPTVSTHTGPTVSTHAGPTVSTHAGPTVSAHTGPTDSTHAGPTVSTHAGPTVSTHAGLTSDPKTRAEFLEYACELTLDPDTAHEDLLISAKEKEVKLNPQNQRDPMLRHPERFIHRRQVLCKQGLQADRCYYEVEVHGEKAEIALAYRGIDRKSRTSLSAFGGNDKSWSLDRSKTYAVSHKGDSIELTATPCQRRIGVYLKFKEGLLTFYEVSGNMRFLYRVETTFTEPLYPGFWLGEKCCIRLCEL